jgi:hypothetical protein
MNLAQPERYRGTLITQLGNVTLRVVYSDESESEPIIVIAALIMNMDEHWANIESELASVKADAPKSLLHKETELKGNILYSAVRKVEWLRSVGQPIDADLQKARDLLFRILAILIKYPTPIYYGAIDRAGWSNFARHSETGVSKWVERPFLDRIAENPKTTAHDAAFDECLARVDAFAHAALPKNEQVLWIHDRRGSSQQEHQTKRGLYWTKFLAQQGWDPINLTFAGKQEPVRIADAIYFGHSDESLALQLADVCCSTISLQLLQMFYGSKHKYAWPFYSIIQRRVMNDGVAPRYMDWAKRNAL